MRDLQLHNITAAASDSFCGLTEPRRRELMQALLQHLHGFAQETRLTHAEWRGALDFLHQADDISNASRSEFGLLSDGLGLSSLVDLLATTPGSVLGPFHIAGSLWKDDPVDPRPGNEGEVMLLRGRVRDAQGQALPQRPAAPGVPC